MAGIKYPEFKWKKSSYSLCLMKFSWIKENFLFEQTFIPEFFLLALFDLVKQIISFEANNLSFFSLYEGTGEHISKLITFLSEYWLIILCYL